MEAVLGREAAIQGKPLFFSVHILGRLLLEGGPLLDDLWHARCHTWVFREILKLARELMVCEVGGRLFQPPGLWAWPKTHMSHFPHSPGQNQSLSLPQTTKLVFTQTTDDMGATSHAQCWRMSSCSTFCKQPGMLLFCLRPSTLPR